MQSDLDCNKQELMFPELYICGIRTQRKKTGRKEARRKEEGEFAVQDLQPLVDSGKVLCFHLSD
jgi:hypothetical protein